MAKGAIDLEGKKSYNSQSMSYISDKYISASEKKVKVSPEKGNRKRNRVVRSVKRSVRGY